MNAETIHLNPASTNTMAIHALLHLADDSLIMGHRCSEWCGHGPILEQDIALTNIALDFVGQSRHLYQYIATQLQDISNDVALTLIDFDILPEKINEDSLAYLRDTHAFKNHLLVELPNGDWTQTILKICSFSVYRFYLFQLLQKHTDLNLAGIAEKSLKEVQYHVKWSSEWIIRLGDGTHESKSRMLQAIEFLWPYMGEMFEPVMYEKVYYHLDDVTYTSLKNNWLDKMNQIFEQATLPTQSLNQWHQTGGKIGKHTEHLGYILAEMQFLPRTFPNAIW